MEYRKQIIKWGVKYYSHLSSYDPVLQIGIVFRDLKFMAPLPCATLSKMDEETMKD